MIRKAMAGLGILVLLAGAAQAQQERRRGGGPERYLGGTADELKKALELSDEQTTQVESLYKKLKEQLEELQNQLRELIQGSRTDLQELLDDDQKEKLTELQRNNRRRGRGGNNRRQGRNRRGGGLPNLDTLKEQLELTEDQVGKIEPLYEELRNDIRERVRELREEGIRGEEMRTEIGKIAKEHIEKIKEELTEEQQGKLNELMARRSGTPSEGGERGNRRRRNRPNVEETIQKLGLEEDEAEAVKTALEKIREAQRSIGEWNRAQTEELRKLLDDEAGDNEIQEKMDAIRKERQEKGKEVQKLRTELLESLTPSQVARLWVDGVLR